MFGVTKDPLGVGPGSVHDGGRLTVRIGEEGSGDRLPLQ